MSGPIEKLYSHSRTAEILNFLRRCIRSSWVYKNFTLPPRECDLFAGSMSARFWLRLYRKLEPFGCPARFDALRHGVTKIRKAPFSYLCLFLFFFTIGNLVASLFMGVDMTGIVLRLAAIGVTGAGSLLKIDWNRGLSGSRLLRMTKWVIE